MVASQAATARRICSLDRNKQIAQSRAQNVAIQNFRPDPGGACPTSPSDAPLSLAERERVVFQVEVLCWVSMVTGSILVDGRAPSTSMCGAIQTQYHSSISFGLLSNNSACSAAGSSRVSRCTRDGTEQHDLDPIVCGSSTAFFGPRRRGL